MVCVHSTRGGVGGVCPFHPRGGGWCVSAPNAVGADVYRSPKHSD